MKHSFLAVSLSMTMAVPLLTVSGCSGAGGSGPGDAGKPDSPVVLSDVVVDTGVKDHVDAQYDVAEVDDPLDVAGGDSCVPSCEKTECGDDGCGGSCGECGKEEVCKEGVCECEFVACNLGCCPEGKVCWMGGCCKPDCEGVECGDDGCGGADACGVCPDGQTCWFHQCCIPDCEGKECGPDGCGGFCGECTGAALCVDGTCCTPDCNGKECGDDGCGASCGGCMANKVCDAGACVDDPGWVGCSDGTREGFIHVNSYPLIAGCGGAWDVPGIHNETPACGRKAGNSGENPNGTGCNVTDLCAAGWHVCLGKMDVMYRSKKGCEEIMEGAQSPAFFLTRTSSTGAFNCAPDAIGDVTTVNDIFGCGDLGCPMTQGKCADGKGCVPGVQCKDCAKDLECVDGSNCTPSVCWPLTRGSHDGCAGLRNDMKSCTYNETTGQWGGGWCCWCHHLLYWPDQQNSWECGGKGDSEASDVVKTDPYNQGGVLCCKDQCVTDAECGDGMECVMSTCQKKN